MREKLELAVKLIVDCQNDQGAWRYVPYAIDSDMSITVCQLQALRAADPGGGIKLESERALTAMLAAANELDGRVASSLLLITMGSSVSAPPARSASTSGESYVGVQPLYSARSAPSTPSPMLAS